MFPTGHQEDLGGRAKENGSYYLRLSAPNNRIIGIYRVMEKKNPNYYMKTGYKLGIMYMRIVFRVSGLRFSLKGFRVFVLGFFLV